MGFMPWQEGLKTEPQTLHFSCSLIEKQHLIHLLNHSPRESGGVENQVEKTICFCYYDIVVVNTFSNSFFMHLSDLPNMKLLSFSCFKAVGCNVVFQLGV